MKVSGIQSNTKMQNFGCANCVINSEKSGKNIDTVIEEVQIDAEKSLAKKFAKLPQEVVEKYSVLKNKITFNFKEMTFSHADDNGSFINLTGAWLYTNKDEEKFIKASLKAHTNAAKKAKNALKLLA